MKHYGNDFEMARALGEELQKTPQVEALVAAKAAYESDPEIAKLVEEYTSCIMILKQR